MNKKIINKKIINKKKETSPQKNLFFERVNNSLNSFSQFNYSSN